MTDEKLRTALMKINGGKKFNKEALKLWRKHPALRVISAWRWSGRSGLSLPTIAYLSGVPMIQVRRSFQQLGRKILRTYCGDTGHVIYYPNLERCSNELSGMDPYGRFTYSFTDEWEYSDGWSWGGREAADDERRLFKKKIYPHQRTLNKMTEEEVRAFSVIGHDSSAITKVRWNRLKRAAALSG